MGPGSDSPGTWFVPRRYSKIGRGKVKANNNQDKKQNTGNYSEVRREYPGFQGQTAVPSISILF